MEAIYSKYKAKPNQSIIEHTNDVLEVYEYLVEKNQECFDTLPDFFQDDFKFMKELVRYHDAGKINHFFQEFITKQDMTITKEQRQHAMYSFFIWFLDNFKETSFSLSKEKVWLAYAIIYGHHKKMRDLTIPKLTTKNKATLENDLKLHLAKQKNNLLEVLPEDFTMYEIGDFEDIMDYFDRTIHQNVNFKNDGLLDYAKFAYSLLVVSDSIASKEATAEKRKELVEFLFGRSIQDSTVLHAIQTSPFYQSAANKHPNDAFEQQQTMNDVRSLLNAKSIHAYQENNFIYVLEAPVGTGKTASSISLAAEIIQNENKKKIIAVFPLNSVQEQYVEVLQNDYGVKEADISVINSVSIFGMGQEKNGSEIAQNSINEEESVYEQWFLNKNYMSNPVIVTSHVKFFDILKAIKRKDALAFLNLKDAVVVIDEFQNYKKEIWFLIWHELIQISKLFGTRWIFTTGTFPVPKKELVDNFQEHVHFVLDEETERIPLFNHSCIKTRYHFKEFNDFKFNSTHKLKEEILFHINHQLDENKERQIIICLNFVKHAKEVFDYLNQQVDGYKMFFLTGRHNALYKKELIRAIKKMNATREKIILVTTKTVECGMDFDFDVGFKEFDTFDSAEQLSGRVNRSNKKSKSRVYLFILNRRRLGNETFFTQNINYKKTIEKLNNKEFDDLYTTVYENNRKELKKYKKELLATRGTLSFEDYSKKLEIIEEADYFSELIVVKNVEEQAELESIIYQYQPLNCDSYEEKHAKELYLQNALEKFKIIFTNKWLNEFQLSYLFLNSKETEVKNTIEYYVPLKSLHTFLEEYEVNGVKSYIEKDIATKEEPTFEQY